MNNPVSSLDKAFVDKAWKDASRGGTYKVGVRSDDLQKNTFKYAFEMDTENLPHGVIPGFTKLFMMAEPADTLVPLIAKSEPVTHAQSDGSVHYEIEIQNGIKWSDGTSITSADIEYSFNLFHEATEVGDYATRIASAIQDLTISVTSANTVRIQSSVALPWMKMRPLLQMPIFPKAYWNPLSHPTAGNATAMTATGSDAPLAAPFRYSATTSENIVTWVKDTSSSFVDSIAYRVCEGGGVTMIDPKSRLSQHDYDGGCPIESTHDEVHFGPHVDSVEFHLFPKTGSGRTAMFEALHSTSLNYAIHNGDNWEGVPVQYPFHKSGFKTYRNIYTTQFNMFMDQGKLGDFFPANNKAFRQVMACMTQSQEIFDGEKHSTRGNMGRYYDDMFSELTSAMGVYDNWKELGFYGEPKGVFKTCGDAKIGGTGNKVDLDTSRSILQAAGWQDTDWGGEKDDVTNFYTMYKPIQNLTYQGQHVKTLRLIGQNVKPYRLQALFLTQIGMNDLGIDAIVKPEDFRRSYSCARVDGTDPVQYNPDGCTDIQQFRVYAGGDKYPFKGDVPSFPESFFSSTGNERFMSHHAYDDLINAIHSATKLTEVKAAVRAFQEHLDEEVPIIPMFKFKHKDVFYRTAIPYSKVHFGGYHTGTTMGGFASVVKVL